MRRHTFGRWIACSEILHQLNQKLLSKYKIFEGRRSAPQNSCFLFFSEWISLWDFDFGAVTKVCNKKILKKEAVFMIFKKTKKGGWKNGWRKQKVFVAAFWSRREGDASKQASKTPCLRWWQGWMIKFLRCPKRKCDEVSTTEKNNNYKMHKFS